MRQRVNNRGVDGEHRVEEVCKAYPVGFGDQTEQGAVAVETPWSALLHEIKARLVISIEKLICYFAGGRLVSKFEGLGTKPLHIDNCNKAVGKNATN